MSNTKIYNPANLFTFTRIIVLPFLVWSMYSRNITLSLAFIIYSGIVDLLDGKVARFFDCATGFGEILDAIADALLFLTVMVCASLWEYANPWAVAAFLTAGLINASGRIIYIKFTSSLKNFKSYASEVIGGSTFFLLLAVIVDYYTDLFIWLIALITFIVAVHDLIRIFSLTKGNSNV